MIIENEDMGNLGDFSFFFTNEKKKKIKSKKNHCCVIVRKLFGKHTGPDANIFITKFNRLVLLEYGWHQIV